MLIYGHFQTELKTCPYLHDRPSRLHVRLVADLHPEEHGALLAAGVRHFGRSYFRPACLSCVECVSIRIPVRAFLPSRSQRRVLRKNRDVALEIGEPDVDEERLALYRSFHAERERTRGWMPSDMDLEEYVSSFLDNPVGTLEFRYRLGSRLVAVAYVDESPDALNSIFAYWDPSCFRRSLGTFDVLTEIREALLRGKDYLYLGYHVSGCRSLAYKRAFRPYEVLLGGRWAGEEELQSADLEGTEPK